MKSDVKKRLLPKRIKSEPVADVAVSFVNDASIIKRNC